MSLFTHWVCFDCRKSFHKLPNEEAWKCPECTKPMIDMGVYFEPPRRQGIRRWEAMRVLAQNGYRFHTEGNAYFIEKNILIMKSPNPENIRRKLEVTKDQLIFHKLWLADKEKREKKWREKEKRRGY